MNLKNYIRFYALILALITATNLIGEGFVAGTLICTPQGYVAIENLSIDDQVITCDFGYGYRVVPIVAVTRQEVDDFVRIKISNATIDVAPDQTFFVPYTQKWIQASHLVEGICVLGAPLKADYVENVATIEQKACVYNLSLAEHHNYLVGPRHVMVHNFGEFGCATFGVLEAAQGTTALNAFLLAHPLIAPVVICAGGATLIGYVAWSFWNIFKQSRNVPKKDNSCNNNRRRSAAQQAKKSKYNKPCNHYRSHKHPHVQSQCVARIECVQPSLTTNNKENSNQFIVQAQELYDRTVNSGTTDAEIRGACATGQLNDATLPASSCLPELHNNLEHFLYPEQEIGIEQSSCDTVRHEPVREPRPCGYQGQRLPGFGSDDIPISENEDASEGESEEIETGGNKEGQADGSSEPDEIEIEHDASDNMSTESLQIDSTIDDHKIIKTVQDLIDESQPGEETSGYSTLYQRLGGFLETLKDFESLNPQHVRDLPGINPGKHGILPDGRDVIARLKSSKEGPPTLEIQNKPHRDRIKFRYVGDNYKK